MTTATTPNTMVISNLAPGDESFDSDVGSWNVTRASRDCAAGRHKQYFFSTAEVYENSKAVEVDQKKIDSMIRNSADLMCAPPVIFAVENERLYLIDGHHRLRAYYELGIPAILGYVIEYDDGSRYRVYFNGNRIAPWLRGDNVKTDGYIHT